MTKKPTKSIQTWLRGPMVATALALLIGTGAPRLCGATPPAPLPPGLQASDPWTAADLLAPATLAKTLAGTAADRPPVFCVGFSFLYQSAHVPGAKLAGPASRPAGLAALKHAVAGLPKDQPIVIYCGCCPVNDCPNIRPAFRTLKEMGFRQIRVLWLPQNFPQDWTAAGFPIAKGAGPG